MLRSREDKESLRRQVNYSNLYLSVSCCTRKYCPSIRVRQSATRSSESHGTRYWISSHHWASSYLSVTARDIVLQQKYRQLKRIRSSKRPGTRHNIWRTMAAQILAKCNHLCYECFVSNKTGYINQAFYSKNNTNKKSKSHNSFRETNIVQKSRCCVGESPSLNMWGKKYL